MHRKNSFEEVIEKDDQKVINPYQEMPDEEF